MNPQELFQSFLQSGWPCWIALSDPRLAQALGTTPSALRKAVWRGALPVAVTLGAGRRQGVLLADLTRWLAGANGHTATAQPAGTPELSPAPRRLGRPRKSATLSFGGVA